LTELANMVDNLIIIDNWEVKFSGTVASFQNSANNNLQIKTSDDDKTLEILNTRYSNHKITLLENWIMIEDFKKSNELLKLVIDSKIDVLEFTNNSSDIESAYISLTS
jgi:ABC-type multidrug transport system ATPase subunit